MPADRSKIRSFVATSLAAASLSLPYTVDERYQPPDLDVLGAEDPLQVHVVVVASISRHEREDRDEWQEQYTLEIGVMKVVDETPDSAAELAEFDDLAQLTEDVIAHVRELTIDDPEAVCVRVNQSKDWPTHSLEMLEQQRAFLSVNVFTFETVV